VAGLQFGEQVEIVGQDVLVVFIERFEFKLKIVRDLALITQNRVLGGGRRVVLVRYRPDIRDEKARDSLKILFVDASGGFETAVIIQPVLQRQARREALVSGVGFSNGCDAFALKKRL
jgi:hypothetical protein